MTTALDQSRPLTAPPRPRLVVAEPQAPAVRHGSVPRERLVQRLRRATDVSLVALVAPAGYGKTTLLRQWAASDPRPFAWISLTREHDDPARLSAAIERALAWLAPAPAGSVLVLDDAHRLQAPATLERLTATIAEQPAGSLIALASRSEPGVRVGRLRAQGALLDLHAEDLAMTRREGASLLHEAGMDLPYEVAASLVQRVEGWPAGLFLAALSLHGEPDPLRAAARFAGDDRFVADFLRDELLDALPAERRAFLTRTSVLERVSGPACDAVLGRTGSGTVLRDLARSDLMLVALDRTDTSFRYHRLLTQALRAELRRGEPKLEQRLHRRASAWYAGRGDVESAIEHAIQARDPALAGDLLWRSAAGYATGGRHVALRRWLDRFPPDELAREPTLALTAATLHLAMGDRDRLEHWAAVAERAGAADGAALAVMSGAVGRDGVAQMAADAARGRALGADGAWLALSHLLTGVAAHLQGDREGARADLEEGGRRGAIAAPLVQVLCLAQLALVALDAGDMEGAALLVSRARGQVDRVGVEDCPTACLVFAVSALVRAHRASVEDAKEDRRRATALLAGAADGAPWYAIETHVTLARATLRLGDVAAARGLLDAAARLLRAAPDPGVLKAWIAGVRAQVDAFSAASLSGPASLTTAELRVLRLLPTHLSFREMGAHLHVSGNTIKTHAHAVYRKLDVGCRSEAVGRARDMGLLDGPR